MHKLATIGVLAVALAGPASAYGKRAPVRPSVQALCAKSVIISPARGYGLCGGTFWLRGSGDIPEHWPSQAPST